MFTFPNHSIDVYIDSKVFSSYELNPCKVYEALFLSSQFYSWFKGIMLPSIFKQWLTSTCTSGSIPRFIEKMIK